MPAAVERSEHAVSGCFRLGPRGFLAQAVRGHFGLRRGGLRFRDDSHDSGGQQTARHTRDAGGKIDAIIFFSFRRMFRSPILDILLAVVPPPADEVPPGVDASSTGLAILFTRFLIREGASVNVAASNGITLLSRHDALTSLLIRITLSLNGCCGNWSKIFPIVPRIGFEKNGFPFFDLWSSR
jgi:hypothetical protein